MLRSPSIEHIDSNTGGMTLRGGSAEMMRHTLHYPRVEGSLRKGREGGLIEFEVGETVQVEDEAFKMERGIEVEGD